MLTREVFKRMKARRFCGSVVNVSSNAIRFAGANSLHYTSAKASLDQLTQGFSCAGAPLGIRVNSVRLGVVNSQMADRVTGYSMANFEKRVTLVPMGRSAQTNEVVTTILHLCQPASAYMTGQVIRIAGGE